MKTSTKLLIGGAAALAIGGVAYYRAAQRISVKPYFFGFAAGGKIDLVLEVYNPSRIFSFPVPMADIGVFDDSDRFLGTARVPILQLITPGISYINTQLEPNYNMVGTVISYYFGQRPQHLVLQGVIKLGRYRIPLQTTTGLAGIGAVYKQIPQQFYACADGTYSDHNRKKACTRHGGLLNDEEIRLCNNVTMPAGTELNVYAVPVKDIKLYLKKFQNRETPYSAESVQRITDAAHAGTFRFEEFDPVLLWRSPDKQLYMLSGHSRLEAFTRLSKEGYKQFDNIPAKIVEVSQQEAEEIALRSNTLSTKEKDFERAMFYRKEIDMGRSYAQVIDTARKNEGKDAVRIVAYAYLNPAGKTFVALKSLESGDPTSSTIIKSIAQWVGEARMKYPMLSNLHEDEIYTWLVNGAFGKQYKRKEDFLNKIAQTINQRTTFGNFDSEKPLNLANVAVRSFTEQQYYDTENDLKLKIATQERLIKEKTADYRSRGADTGKILELLAADNGYLNRLRVELSQWMQKKNTILSQAESAPSLFAISGYRPRPFSSGPFI